MIMINTNFTKQDNQNPSVTDPLDKDTKADDFTALMAGLCMTPQSTPVKAIPVSEKPAEESDVELPVELPAEFPTAGNPADLDAGSLTETKNPALAQVLQPVEPEIKAGQNAPDLFKSTGERTDTKFLPADGNIKMAPQVVIPVKPIIKDLKTQGNKFEEVPPVTGQIAGVKNFAAMAKEKAAFVQSLSNTGTPAHLEPGIALTDGDATDQGLTHFDHNYVDPIRLADLIRDRTQRKLPKLISEVTDLAAEENGPVLHGELTLQSETSLLPKVTAMLEQIKPAVIQLAAAAANDGKQILKMRLHPAELGTVEIRLEKNDAGVIEAHFRTDNDAAKHFLTQGLDQLRNSLENAGWQVGKMEISSSPFSSGDSSAQKGAGQSNETSSNSSSAKTFEPDPTRSDDSADSAADHLVSLRA